MERLLTQVKQEQGSVSPAISAMALTLTGRIGLGNADLEQATYWYRQSLALLRTLPDQRLLALTMGGLALAEGGLGNYAQVDALFAESIPLLQQIGEQGVLARVSMVCANHWLRRGDLEQAGRNAEVAREAARGVSGQQWAMAGALHTLGWIAYLQQDFPSAHTLEQESVALLRPLSFPTLGMEVLATFAYETLAIGDQENAQTLFEECWTLAEASGDSIEIGRALCGLGYLALHRDERANAAWLLEESIRAMQQIRQLATHHVHILASSLEGVAAITCLEQQPIKATWLLGAADALRHVGASVNPLGREIPFWEQTREATRRALGFTTFCRAFAEGSCMTPMQALTMQEPERNTYLQSQVQDGMLPNGSLAERQPVPLLAEQLPTAGKRLTRREIEVLRWLSQGCSNAEIAEKLVLSIVTVNTYLRSIYSKLGVSSRTRAVRCALDHHLLS